MTDSSSSGLAVSELTTPGSQSAAARTAIALRISVGIALCAYHIYTAVLWAWEPLLHRSLHVAAAMFLGFLYFPARNRAGRGANWWDVFLALLSILPMAHLLLEFDRITDRYQFISEITYGDYAAAAILITLLLTLVRRIIGWPMVIVVGVAAAYGFLGPWIPGFMGHQGLNLYQFVDTQTLSLGGVFSTPVAVSSTYIAIFVIFGAFLVQTGMGQAMIDFANALAGHLRGGPAKVAILSSGLFGSINGSSSANVVATGTFTIPLMKSVGYRPHFAGAIEATASTGGQLMPPVMGAAVFIMVEITNIPYLEIIKAALLPSILFYVALYVMVHLEASRMGLPVSMRPSRQEIYRACVGMLPFAIPIGVLLYILFEGYTVSLAGFWSLAALVFLSYFRKSTRLNLLKIVKGCDDSAKNIAMIAITCAAAGIVIGLFNSLGIGNKFASAIFSASGGYPFVALILVATTCMVLGMGLPTSAAYVIVAAVAVPILIKMDFPMLACHMFALYFACMANITPPIGIPAFVAAGLAGADPMRTCITATRLGIAGYLVPFMFVYSPALLLQGGTFEVMIAAVTGVFGIFGIAVSSIGWLFRILGTPMRILFFIAGCLMVVPGYYTDMLGAVFLSLATLVLWRQEAVKRADYAL